MILRKVAVWTLLWRTSTDSEQFFHFLATLGGPGVVRKCCRGTVFEIGSRDPVVNAFPT